MAARPGAAGREEGAYLNRYVTDPAATHALQLKRLRSESLLAVRENQSRRDLTKVAQYPAAAGLG
jgi:hypothetical protein